MAGKFARRALLGGAAAFGGALAWNWNRIPFGFVQQYVREMDRQILTAKNHPDPRNWPDKGIHAAWLGHSTVLMKIDGTTVITDPVFSQRAGIDLFLFTIGVKRLVNPALDLKQLPPIDLILVSHAHMDHLDIPSLRALENKGTRVVTAPETSDLFRAQRYGSLQELRWNESAQVGEARVTGLEVNHWGARMRTDTHRGYNGYLVQVGSRQVLFAGDTADTQAFAQLPGNAKPDVAIFPIGAYNPWIHAHCTPEQAWRMANEARAEAVLPVHHQTFTLSREPLFEPIERFHAAAGTADGRIGWQDIGATFHWS
ncbi:MAG TPA: MBL fold metallo-hydrolase [Bryobacteraceae bacterium]|nr:MBL fold metallo-hydrolase [Bryobacteraceae bacterium]